MSLYLRYTITSLILTVHSLLPLAENEAVRQAYNWMWINANIPHCNIYIVIYIYICRIYIFLASAVRETWAPANVKYLYWFCIDTIFIVEKQIFFSFKLRWSPGERHRFLCAAEQFSMAIYLLEIISHGKFFWHFFSDTREAGAPRGHERINHFI